MTSSVVTRWERILNKVLALDMISMRESGYPIYCSMDKEAKECFFSWWNRKVERINRIEDDTKVDSREMKHPAHVARLTLIIQVLRYASDESYLQFVDMASEKAAIRLNDISRLHTSLLVPLWRTTPVKNLRRHCCRCCPTRSIQRWP